MSEAQDVVSGGSQGLLADNQCQTLGVNLDESDDMTIESGSHNEVDDADFITKVEAEILDKQEPVDPTGLNTVFMDGTFIEEEKEDPNYVCGNVLDFLNRGKSIVNEDLKEEVIEFQPVDYTVEQPSDKTSAGVIGNSIASILMMSEGLCRKRAYDVFRAENHVEVGVKISRLLTDVQHCNVKRVLKNKMKSRVYMRDHVEYSKTVLELYENDLSTC